MEAIMTWFAVGVAVAAAVAVVAALVTCLTVLLALPVAKAARCREPRNAERRCDG